MNAEFRWTRPLLVAAAVAAFVLAARAATVDGERLLVAGRAVWDFCPARAWDLRCPGCGLGRASVLLARGEWSAARALHPGAFVLLAFAAFEASAMLWSPRARRTARWSLAGALLIVSLAHWI